LFDVAINIVVTIIVIVIVALVVLVVAVGRSDCEQVNTNIKNSH